MATTMRMTRELLECPSAACPTGLSCAADWPTERPAARRERRGSTVAAPVVVLDPRLKRIDDCTRPCGSPMARRTCDGSSVPDEQADPVETAMPSRSSAISSDSASTLLEAMLVVFGTRGAPAPFTAVPGHRREDAGLEPVAQAAPAAPPRRRASLSRSRGGHPEPDDGGHVLGARRAGSAPDGPRSSRRDSGVPRRIHSAPTPLGPPNLCADSDSRSTPSAATSTGILPTACTASVWNSAPARRARGARVRRLAGRRRSRCWRASPRPAPLVCRARSRASRAATTPSASTGRIVTGATRAARSARAVFRTASCSTAVTTSARAPALRGVDDAAEREVVGLGSAAGEHDVARFGANQRGHLGPGVVDGGLGALAEGVDARRVAELVAERARSSPRPTSGAGGWWRCGRDRFGRSSRLRTGDRS